MKIIDSHSYDYDPYSKRVRARVSPSRCGEFGPWVDLGRVTLHKTYPTVYGSVNPIVSDMQTGYVYCIPEFDPDETRFAEVCSASFSGSIWIKSFFRYRLWTMENSLPSVLLGKSQLFGSGVSARADGMEIVAQLVVDGVPEEGYPLEAPSGWYVDQTWIRRILRGYDTVEEESGGDRYYLNPTVTLEGWDAEEEAYSWLVTDTHPLTVTATIDADVTKALIAPPWSRELRRVNSLTAEWESGAVPYVLPCVETATNPYTSVNNHPQPEGTISGVNLQFSAQRNSFSVHSED